MLVNPDNQSEQYVKFMQEAARVKGVQLRVLKARTEDEIDTAFAALDQLQAGGLMISPDPILNSQFKQLVALECLPIRLHSRRF